MITRQDFSIKKDFSKNILTLFSGNGLAQVFNLVGTLIIFPQIYEPEHFGYLAIFMSIATILSVFSTGRYEQAIVLPKEHNEGISVLLLSLSLVAMVSSALLLVFVALLILFPDTIYISDLGKYSLLIPASILFYGGYQSLNFWMVREKRFKAVSGSKVAESAVAFTVTLLIGIFSAWGLGLIIGFVSGQLVAFLYLSILFFRRKPIGKEDLKLDLIRGMAKKYVDFPKFNLFQVLFDMIQKYGAVFIIERFFGYRILGNYHLVYRALRGPLALVGLAFSQVFFQKASELYNTGGDYYGILKKSLLALSAFSIPVFTILFFAIEPIFNWLLGSGYEEAGIIAVILIPWMAFNFISSPVSSFPVILGRQKMFLIITTIGNISGLSILFFLSKLGFGYISSLSFYSFSMMLLMIVIITWNIAIVKKSYGLLKTNKV